MTAQVIPFRSQPPAPQPGDTPRPALVVASLPDLLAKTRRRLEAGTPEQLAQAQAELRCLEDFFRVYGGA